MKGVVKIEEDVFQGGRHTRFALACRTILLRLSLRYWAFRITDKLNLWNYAVLRPSIVFADTIVILLCIMFGVLAGSWLVMLLLLLLSQSWLIALLVREAYRKRRIMRSLTMHDNCSCL